MVVSKDEPPSLFGMCKKSCCTTPQKWRLCYYIDTMSFDAVKTDDVRSKTGVLVTVPSFYLCDFL